MEKNIIYSYFYLYPILNNTNLFLSVLRFCLEISVIEMNRWYMRITRMNNWTDTSSEKFNYIAFFHIFPPERNYNMVHYRREKHCFQN